MLKFSSYDIYPQIEKATGNTHFKIWLFPQRYIDSLLQIEK